MKEKRSKVVEFPHSSLLMLWSLAATVVIKLRCFYVPLDELARDQEGAGGISPIKVGDDDEQQPLCCPQFSEENIS